MCKTAAQILKKYPLEQLELYDPDSRSTRSSNKTFIYSTRRNYKSFFVTTQLLADDHDVKVFKPKSRFTPDATFYAWKNATVCNIRNKIAIQKALEKKKSKTRTDVGNVLES